MSGAGSEASGTLWGGTILDPALAAPVFPGPMDVSSRASPSKDQAALTTLCSQTSCGCFKQLCSSCWLHPDEGWGRIQAMWAVTRAWSFPVPLRSIAVPGGKRQRSRKAGAEHVKGRALLPIKLQIVSQEIAFPPWSCSSQAFSWTFAGAFCCFLQGPDLLSCSETWQRGSEEITCPNSTNY